MGFGRHNFSTNCFFNTSFGGSFMKKLPTLLQIGANLAPPFRCSSPCFFVFLHASLLLPLHYSSFYFNVFFHVLPLLLLCYYSSYFVTHFHALLLLSMFCHSSSCFATPLYASLFLFLLHNSFVFHHSSRFIAPPLVNWLLLIMLDYYSMLHFTVTHCASMLLIVLHCCSMFLFVTPTSMLLHLSPLFVLHCCSYFVSHVVSLSCGASLLLYASLFSCPPRYLFAPCCFVALLCFVVAQCVATPLFKLVFCTPPPPPPPATPLFLQGFGNLNLKLIGRKLENIQGPSCQ